MLCEALRIAESAAKHESIGPILPNQYQMRHFNMGNVDGGMLTQSLSMRFRACLNLQCRHAPPSLQMAEFLQFF